MTQEIALLTRSGFDIQAAVLVGNAAELAYEDDGTVIANWARNKGFTSATAFNRGNIQGFWAISDNVALLAFRGTSNIGQWIRDARLLPTSHPWGPVHSGFSGGIQQVNTDLQPFEEAAKKVEHVSVTGHSLGGALAVLASARLKEQGMNPLVYTYGQPRVGLAAFAEKYDIELPDRLWRFINQNDIVPRVPPGLLYRHCGTVKRIVRPGVLEAMGLNEATAPELENSDLPPLTEEECNALLNQLDEAAEPSSLEGVQLESRLTSLFSDHSMLAYLRLLKEIRDQEHG